MVRGLAGQGEEHTGGSKCNWKSLEGSREKWACPDLNICKKNKNFTQAVMQKVDLKDKQKEISKEADAVAQAEDNSMERGGSWDENMNSSGIYFGSRDDRIGGGLISYIIQPSSLTSQADQAS